MVVVTNGCMIATVVECDKAIEPTAAAAQRLTQLMSIAYLSRLVVSAPARTVMRSVTSVCLSALLIALVGASVA